MAWYRDSREEVEMPLAVEPVRYLTQLALDKPLYKPGETVFYRSLTLSQFALAADRDLPVHFDILAPDGSLVPHSSRDLVTQRGVASGDFDIPEDLAAGRYTLVVRGSDATFRPQKRSLIIQASTAVSAASNGPDASVPNPGQIDVTFFPEGGQLVAALENRVYFVARDAAGKPVQLSGMIVGRGRRDDARDREVAAVETTYEGMGAFSFTPQADEAYRLNIRMWHGRPGGGEQLRTAEGGRPTARGLAGTRSGAGHRLGRVCRREAVGVQHPCGQGRRAVGRGGVLPRRAGGRATAGDQTGRDRRQSRGHLLG